MRSSLLTLKTFTRAEHLRYVIAQHTLSSHPFIIKCLTHHLISLDDINWVISHQSYVAQSPAVRKYSIAKIYWTDIYKDSESLTCSNIISTTGTSAECKHQWRTRR